MKTLQKTICTFLQVSKLIYIILFVAFLNTLLFAQGNGTITGKVVDKTTGESLIGVNVIILGSNYGDATDLNGQYTIRNIPPGSYTVAYSMIGFEKKNITELIVNSNDVTKIDITLEEEAFETDEVVISAEALKDSEAGLLINRQKSNSVSDAISSELINRSGSGNAADAITKVTGASVVGGKYVYIRGLGDRYSSTQLNGAELPSSDPDVKSFNLDLFPSNLLDNLVTIKSFTPDKPGSFSGGLVDVTTKNYPEKFTLKISSATSYNSLSTFSSDFLTHRGGSTDWLGLDDGTRNIPDLLSDPNVVVPSPNSARRDRNQAYRLDELSKSFNPEMWTSQRKALPNQSYSFSIGDQTLLFGQPLGFNASLSYKRELNFYNDGAVGRWQLSGNYNETNGLNNYFYLNDAKGVDEVLWGGIFNIAYQPQPEHDLSFRVLYTQSGVSTSRYQDGPWRNQLGDNATYETRSLLYTERNLKSYQMSGKHYLKEILSSTLNWTASYSSSQQDEPDLRFFSNDYEVNNNGDFIYDIHKNSYNEPTRFYRNLTEKNFNTNVDISVPFTQWANQQSKFKFGGSFSDINREFRERRFEYRSSTSNYNGDNEDYFINQTGITDSSNNRYIFGNYIFDASTPRSNYNGSQTIGALYAMVELPIFSNLKFVGGARYETTDLNVTSQDSAEVPGVLDNKDFLPSASLIYQLNPVMNLRFSYGRTLARPSFRELAPFRSFEFLGDFQFIGNPELKRTLIDNFDIRWEWFHRPGELYAVSFFYKSFDNPIERAFNPTTELISFQNVNQGNIYGAEFEIRNKLDFIHPVFNDFLVNLNFSLIKSVVDIPDEEFNTLILPYQPDAEQNRPLFGQSPYLINVEFSYINPESGTTASLFYNIFGDRLSEVTLGVTPDVYERSRSILDFTFTQHLIEGLIFNFAVKNLLDSKISKTIRFKDVDYIFHEYKLGREFKVGFSYNI